MSRKEEIKEQSLTTTQSLSRNRFPLRTAKITFTLPCVMRDDEAQRIFDAMEEDLTVYLRGAGQILTNKFGGGKLQFHVEV